MLKEYYPNASNLTMLYRMPDTKLKEAYVLSLGEDTASYTPTTLGIFNVLGDWINAVIPWRTRA